MDATWNFTSPTRLEVREREASHRSYFAFDRMETVMSLEGLTSTVSVSLHAQALWLLSQSASSVSFVRSSSPYFTQTNGRWNDRRSSKRAWCTVRESLNGLPPPNS